AKRHAAILDMAQRHLLQVPDLRLRLRPAVGLDESNNDVQALTLQLVGVLEHLVALADPGRGADVHTQPGAALVFGLREQRPSGAPERRAGPETRPPRARCGDRARTPTMSRGQSAHRTPQVVLRTRLGSPAV